MDKTGLKEILSFGQRIILEKWHSLAEMEVTDEFFGDQKTNEILDRFGQMGISALEHDVKWLWDEVVDAFLKVYRVPLAQSPGSLKSFSGQPTNLQAQWFIDVINRVFLLGASAVHFERYSYATSLILKCPDERLEYIRWIRHAVIMAARGNMEEWENKSLIGPVSEFIRERKFFLGLFEGNLDNVTNALCQFDFLNCLIVALKTQKIESIYPNFGNYSSYRTVPIIEDLIENGPSRKALPDFSDKQIAEALVAINSTIDKAFILSVWDGYGEKVNRFINNNLGERR